MFESPAILLAKQPPEDVRTYLLEATRCYTYGLFQACAILSRAGVHAALLDRLDAKGERVIPSRKDEFARVIAFARERGILGEEDRVRADSIRGIGGRAAHGEKVTQAHGRKALIELRQLFARLYA